MPGNDIARILNSPMLYKDREQPDQQAKNALDDFGLFIQGPLIFDGNLHRCASSDKPGDDAGWYVLFKDGDFIAGAFGDWRSGEKRAWHSQLAREIDPIEKAALDRRIADAMKRSDDEKKARNKRAAETVRKLWQDGAPASDDFPYLAKKRIMPHGARISGDGRLMLPLFNASGDLSSLQYISSDGEKRYHTGSATKGCFCVLGAPEKNKGRLYITEGFATGATVHEATGFPVCVAYSAGELDPVTKTMREKYGTIELVIVADNDKSGTGKKHADQASANSGARVVMPPTEGMDANDYAQSGGDLMQLLDPPLDEWLVSADEFSKQPQPINWLVQHWIQQDALIMVHGPSGCGKTFLVLDWCCRIASGLDLWEGKRVKASSVVYLAGEGHHGLRGRVAAWKQHNKVKSMNMWLSRSACDLNQPADLQGVLERLRRLPERVGLVVVDTLHRFLDGDENSAEDVRGMIAACAKIQQEFECTVLLVHHTGVSDEAQHRARGSSAWRGALDIEVSVNLVGDKTMRIRQMKSKDSEQAEDVFMTLESVNLDGWLDENNEPVTSAVVMSTVEPPAKGRKKEERDEAELKSIFADIWAWSGREIDDENNPKLMVPAMTNYFTEFGYMENASPTADAAKKHGQRIIKALIDAKLIERGNEPKGTPTSLRVKNNAFSSYLFIRQ